VTRSNILLGTNQVQADVRRNTLHRQYWTPENAINTYPVEQQQQQPAERAVLRGRQLRAPARRLGGVRPAHRAERRVGTQSLRLYVTGRNLWTAPSGPGLDPELTSQRAVPLERTIIGGVNARF
jgi:hypothetical protein